MGRYTGKCERKEEKRRRRKNGKYLKVYLEMETGNKAQWHMKCKYQRIAAGRKYSFLKKGGGYCFWTNISTLQTPKTRI